VHDGMWDNSYRMFVSVMHQLIIASLSYPLMRQQAASSWSYSDGYTSTFCALQAYYRAYLASCLSYHADLMSEWSFSSCTFHSSVCNTNRLFPYNYYLSAPSIVPQYSPQNEFHQKRTHQKQKKNKKETTTPTQNVYEASEQSHPHP